MEKKYKRLFFFPVHQFASNHISFKNIDSFFTPFDSEWVIQKYAKKGYSLYVMILDPSKRIMLLKKGFKLEHGHILVTVPTKDSATFEEWARDSGLIEKRDSKNSKLEGALTPKTLHELVDFGSAEEHYVVGDYINCGLYSKVYQGSVVNDKNQGKMAIKVMPLNDEDVRIKLATNEIRALKRVKHKNVVKLHSARLTGDGKTLYIALEYIPGFNLYLWVDERSKQLRKNSSSGEGSEMIMPLPKVKYAARRLFAGLRAIHRVGIAHQDLDTSNICITNPEDQDHMKPTIIDLNGSKMDCDNMGAVMEEDIIRLTMVVLELGMKPQPENMPRLVVEQTSEYFAGALISIPRWTSDVAIARRIFKMSQNRTDGSIVAYPEVIEFVGYVMRLDEGHQVTVDNVFKHPFLKK
jgi:tRNA A-37 threonylcarbamoyl transferase component Bud32